MTAMDYQTTPLRRAQVASCRRAMVNRRIALGLRQRDVAARLGVARPLISKVETGRIALPLHHLQPLAALLHMEARDLWPLAIYGRQKGRV